MFVLLPRLKFNTTTYYIFCLPALEHRLNFSGIVENPADKQGTLAQLEVDWAFQGVASKAFASFLQPLLSKPKYQLSNNP